MPASAIRKPNARMQAIGSASSRGSFTNAALSSTSTTRLRTDASGNVRAQSSVDIDNNVGAIAM
jgi:hypothetical protein